MIQNKILIKASLPGSGKTYLLTELFKDYNPEDKYEKVVFITKTNKALDNAKNFLNGERLENKSFRTLSQFKENWKIIPNIDKTERLVNLKSTDHTSRYYYTIFIDEISMISQYEMDDLLNSFLVANIIAAGDTSQHSPIAAEYWEKTSSGLQSYIDDGSPIDPSFWTQVFEIDKPYRFNDPKLVETLNILKTKQIITKEFLEERFEFLDTWHKDGNNLHICYTNEKVDEINKEYGEKISRFIIEKKWRFENRTYQHGQFIDEETKHILESELDFNKIIVPAMAITSHKIQGWTAQPGHTIMIHLDDFADFDSVSFMHSLWVALTRAPNLNQIKFIGVTSERAANMIDKHITSNWYQSLTNNPISQEEIYEEIMSLLKSCNFDKESDPRYVAWIAKYGKAHSVKHKQHKQHKQYKSKIDRLNKDEILEYLKDHSKKETMENFEISRAILSKYLKS